MYSRKGAIISFSDGQQLRSNPNTTISFARLATGEFVKNNITGGFLSTFTSWGPTNELAIKPNVAAPGGIIYSTFPLALGGFQIDQGTSMATPYITGVAALYLSAKGQTSPLKMKDLMTYDCKSDRLERRVHYYSRYESPGCPTRRRIGRCFSIP